MMNLLISQTLISLSGIFIPLAPPMAILPQEPNLFPENLFDLFSLNDEQDRTWWAIYTMSRREKSLMRYLKSKEIPFYTPIIGQKKRAPNGRMRESFLPLFTNYVFFYGNEEMRREALTSNSISRFLKVPDPEQLNQDLRQIQKIIDSGLSVLPESNLVPGTRVRITDGALLGTEGTIIQRRSQSRLVVEVKFLQQGASVLVDDFSVEAITT